MSSADRNILTQISGHRCNQSQRGPYSSIARAVLDQALSTLPHPDSPDISQEPWDLTEEEVFLDVATFRARCLPLVAALQKQRAA